MPDLKPLGSRPSIYRSNSAYIDFEITNSRIVNVDEKGHIVSENNSIVSIQEEGLKKGLKNRHIQLIALGGAIGTGLFVGSGAALHATGPAALLLSYCILSLIVWFVMNMMAEMAAFLPVPGAGAQQFINDYTDPSFGFALGYNYWYGFSILVATEIVVAALVIQYWTEKVPIAVWITILLVLILALNLCPVQFYGEAEFYFAGIKLITITGLIILGVVLFFGGGPNHDRLGFRYWKHGNAFHEYKASGALGRFLAFWYAIIKAGYSFIMSPELIVACSGEVSNPRKALPRCANQFVYRLAFFYILGSLVIGVIADSNSEKLVASTDVTASPFVLGIQNAGIPVLNHIINAVVLTSAASAGNSFFYAGSRTLYSLAKKGLAPRLFTTVNRWGVPYYCVAVTFCVGCLGYLNVSSSSSQVFAWFSNISTISGFISWIFVAIAYTRWRKAIVVQNLLDRVPYRTPFQPYGAYIVIGFISLVTITNGFSVFIGGFSALDFVAAYVTLPIVAVLYIGHRIYSIVVLKRKNWLTPLEEIDFSKLELVEYEHSQIVERLPRNRWEKILFAIF